MDVLDRPTITNRLLQALPADDLARLQPHFEFVDLKLKQVLQTANSPIQHLYFLQGGYVSVVATASDGRQIETGLYGRDGVGNTAVLMGDTLSCNEVHFIQLPGTAFRIRSDIVLEAAEQSPSLNKMLLRYSRCFQLQIAQTALSNGNYSLDERLARWLLMCHDRTDGDDLLVTHEFLGLMLAVRRSGVTLALHILEGKNIIKSKRGCVTIRNRAKLEEIAGGSYGPAEAAYERLIGPMR